MHSVTIGTHVPVQPNMAQNTFEPFLAENSFVPLVVLAGVSVEDGNTRH